MNKKKFIDSGITSLKGMLGETNNELSFEQQRMLKGCIRELKRLQKAERLTHQQIFAAVDLIAQTALDVLKHDEE